MDVLEVRIRVGGETARQLESLAAGAGMARGGNLPAPLADDLADAVASARQALVRIRFRRNISLQQFLDGMRESLQHAVDAGYLSARGATLRAEETARAFSPLEGRGFRSGDALWYRVRGEALEMVLPGPGLTGHLIPSSSPPERPGAWR